MNLNIGSTYSIAYMALKLDIGPVGEVQWSARSLLRLDDSGSNPADFSNVQFG